MKIVLLGLVAAVTAVAVAVLLRTGPANPPQPSTVDIGFAQDMAIHHDQAVLMAGIARDRASAPMRGIAATIEVGQSAEAGTLRGWLTLWGEPSLPRGEPMTWMSAKHDHMEGMGHTSMPGMATMGQIGRLQALEGPVFDREFAKLMIRHHEGGILMAEDAARRASLPTTRDFANLVIVGQTQEIAQIRAVIPAG